MPSHVAKATETLLFRSMGKSLRIIAIFTTESDANAYMAKHDNAACIAEFGPFIFLANKYDQGSN